MSKVSAEKALGARKSWREQSDLTRAKIKTSMLINRLQDHAEGKVEMTATQVKAAQVCLDRTMPVMSESLYIAQPAPTANYDDLISQLSGLIGKDQTERILAKLGKKEERQEQQEPPAVTH